MMSQKYWDALSLIDLEDRLKKPVEDRRVGKMQQTKLFTRSIFFLVSILLFISTPTYSQIHPSELRVATNWIDIRDSHIVKQSLDYSCGAASLATVLNEFYGLSVTEADVFNRLDYQEALSFSDIEKVSEDFGFKAGGLRLDFEKLLELQIPAIAYLDYRGQDHFTVITGISRDGIVSVADPSWGNRRFRRAQFEEMWLSAGGRILLIVPNDLNEQTANHNFFSNGVSFEHILQTLTALEIYPFK